MHGWLLARSPILPPAAAATSPPALQVVAGTNYQIRVNLTCPSGVAGENSTLGLEAHVYWPLPGSNEEPEVRALLCCALLCCAD